jgi:hypothetical protein
MEIKVILPSPSILIHLRASPYPWACLTSSKGIFPGNVPQKGGLDVALLQCVEADLLDVFIINKQYVLHLVVSLSSAQKSVVFPVQTIPRTSFLKPLHIMAPIIFRALYFN